MSIKGQENDVKQALLERFALQKEYGGDDKPVNKIAPLVSITVDRKSVV